MKSFRPTNITQKLEILISSEKSNAFKQNKDFLIIPVDRLYATTIGKFLAHHEVKTKNSFLKVHCLITKRLENRIIQEVDSLKIIKL